MTVTKQELDVMEQDLLRAELGLIGMMFEHRGVIRPMFVFIDEDGGHDPQLAVFTNDAEKDAVVEAVAERVRREQPMAVMFIDEAWTVVLDPGETLMVRPSEHPGRIEVLMLSMEFRTGTSFMCSAEIRRDAQGRPSLAPWEVMRDSQGRFTGWFKNEFKMEAGDATRH